MITLNSPSIRILYIDLPQLLLCSNLSELSEVLSLGIQYSFCPQENKTCKKKKKSQFLSDIGYSSFSSFCISSIVKKLFISPSFYVHCYIEFFISFYYLFYVCRLCSVEKEMATNSSILTWRIPWTKKPGGLQSMGLQRVRHDWSNLAPMHAHRLCSDNLVSVLIFRCVFLLFPWAVWVDAY